MHLENKTAFVMEQEGAAVSGLFGQELQVTTFLGGGLAQCAAGNQITVAITTDKLLLLKP